VFFESGVEEFAVPESVLDEVRAYIPAFSTSGLVSGTLLSRCLTPFFYSALLGGNARNNDRDFEQTGVSLYTAAQLLAVLFPKRDK
jgi:hypothetical protein